MKSIQDILADPVDVNKILRERAERLQYAGVIGNILGQPFILAGGAMRSDEPRDFDIFGCDKPIDLAETKRKCERDRRVCLLTHTDNAVTIELYGQTVQLCKHFKGTPMALIRSFDFSHVQAGAVFTSLGVVGEVVFTGHFHDVEAYSYTPQYLGSEYPLSSLVRLVKFKERGDFAGENEDYFFGQLLSILCDIVKRGFRDEDDFRDQCVAISAALPNCDPELLFQLLHKKGGES